MTNHFHQARIDAGPRHMWIEETIAAEIAIMSNCGSRIWRIEKVVRMDKERLLCWIFRRRVMDRSLITVGRKTNNAQMI
ncbi:hypothetical protein [Neobacillus niacini]|uniref:hypothetical protein n=1 Tax=Neobacillus niacini TaxID=86668 RepID=UPI0028558280|nr:hypothetical protein [Neobacillus niacini]MDR7002759.1 hypothetical protein [Neobacillus niacini]